MDHFVPYSYSLAQTGSKVIHGISSCPPSRRGICQPVISLISSGTIRNMSPTIP